jgi:hypothetical protein
MPPVMNRGVSRGIASGFRKAYQPSAAIHTRENRMTRIGLILAPGMRLLSGARPGSRNA